MVVKVIGAILAALIFSVITEDMIDAILVIYSILIGFSFNILFYLLSMNRLSHEENESIERELKVKKLNKLKEELFHNVSYFNIISISLILLAIILLFFYPYDFETLSQSRMLENFFNQTLESSFDWRYHIDLAVSVIKTLFRAVFYYVLIESFYSFLRTTGRVTFYFEEKLALQKQPL